MKSLKSSIFFKVSIIIAIALLLLIPTTMIEDLIYERENTQLRAISEVSSKWAREQTIGGPILTIPYYKFVKQFSSRDSTEKVVKVKDHLHFLPDMLKIDGKVNPEKRYRGIYEVVVYNSKIELSGSFNSLNFKDFDIPKTNIQLDKAFISIGISDLRGLEKQVDLKWNNGTHSFNPGTVTDDVLRSGINTRVPTIDYDSTSYQFSFSLDLKGSKQLYFTPLGKITDVSVSSPWSNPSFNGAYLPDSREITENGFTANWNILHLNRNIPQSFTGGYNFYPSIFGVDLLLPVDSYQKSMRTVKYAILFIALTFMVFFFVEVLNGVFIHPFQYLLVGLALVVFFSLLIAVSEHLKFNLAFILSALATLSLVAGYVKAILKSKNLTLLISGILLVLYGFIFTIIQLQDYSLLIGSIGIFIILALVMYYSRKIDWYNINREQKE